MEARGVGAFINNGKQEARLSRGFMVGLVDRGKSITPLHNKKHQRSIKPGKKKFI